MFDYVVKIYLNNIIDKRLTLFITLVVSRLFIIFIILNDILVYKIEIHLYEGQTINTRIKFETI